MYKTIREYRDANYKHNSAMLKWATEDYVHALGSGKFVKETLTFWREVARVTEYFYWESKSETRK